MRARLLDSPTWEKQSIGPFKVSAQTVLAWLFWNLDLVCAQIEGLNGFITSSMKSQHMLRATRLAQDAMVRDLVQDYQQAFNQLHADTSSMFSAILRLALGQTCVTLVSGIGNPHSRL